MQLDPAVYWKLAATMERLNRQTDDIGRQLSEARAAALKEAGLEPGAYTLSDATCEVTKQEPPA